VSAQDPRQDTRRRWVLAALACTTPIWPPEVAYADAKGYFTEVAQTVGIDFRHFNGMSGEYYLPEIMGSGGALFDWDNDGDLDLYLVQGSMLGPHKTLADALFPPQKGASLTDRLFRNDLATGTNGRPSLRFHDVTAQSGLANGDYGMGVASGDYDNDGWVDLYVTNLGINRLLRNSGNGTFEDVTVPASVGDPSWSVSASFLDFDRDGWLDLYVGNYVQVDLAHHQACHAPSSALDYCTPLVYPAQTDRLYRNRGDGTFEEVSAKAGIDKEIAAALGVMVADYNLDGWPDIYVANDGTANLLWINQGDGTFVNDAFLAGAAVNMAGAAEGSMGVSAGDFDSDGDDDLFMTHLTGETNTVYVNDGKGWFEDRSIGTGLGGPSMAFTGFGGGWLDFDNDGWLDVFVGNGEVSMIRRPSAVRDRFPLHQRNQLFVNREGEHFVPADTEAGPAFDVSEVSRGAAFGDVDNDGDTDILVCNNNGPARLLLNQFGNRSRWIGLRLLEQNGRDAYGARVQVRGDDQRSLWRVVRTDGSYASAGDPRLLFGLGPGMRDVVEEILVLWPDGKQEAWRGLPVNHYATLRYGQGSGVPEHPAPAPPRAALQAASAQPHEVAKP